MDICFTPSFSLAHFSILWSENVKEETVLIVQYVWLRAHPGAVVIKAGLHNYDHVNCETSSRSISHSYSPEGKLVERQ